MSVVKCCRCGVLWTMSTLWPKEFEVIGRMCPTCIPYALPRMGELHSC